MSCKQEQRFLLSYTNRVFRPFSDKRSEATLLGTCSYSVQLESSNNLYQDLIVLQGYVSVSHQL